MSTETVDIRWRFGGDSVDILRSHIEGTEESERTYLGGLSDSKWRSGVESMQHLCYYLVFVCHFTLRNYHVYDAEVAYFSSLAICVDGFP